MERLTKTEGCAPGTALVACLASLALAAALVPAAAIGPVQVAWADDDITYSASAYTWADGSGSTLTSGLTTQSTVYYDGSSTTTYSDSTTIVLSSSGTFTLTADLQADIIVGDGASSSSTHTVTIDLNGHTLKGTGHSSVIIALAYSDVTICDSSTDGTGIITGGIGTYASDSGTTVVTSGYGASTAYHMSSESTRGRSGGAVFIDVRAAVTMTGGTITGNYALGKTGTSTTDYGCGGGVFVNVRDIGYTNSGNADDTKGDGEATFTMTGGAITANEAYFGGGIYCAAGGSYDYTGYTHYNPKVYISGSGTKVDGNTAAYGGGIQGGIGGTISLFDGASVSGNTATGGGGGIYSNGSHVSINTGSSSYAQVLICDNEVSQTSSLRYGGGIYCSGEYAILNIKNAGALISGNKAVNGGGIYCTSWYMYLSGGEVTGNEATGYSTTSTSGTTSYSGGFGGGIYVVANYSSKASYEIYGDFEIKDNTSDSDGGGIYCASCSGITSLKIYGDVKITGNSATNSSRGVWGGGICTYRPTTISGNVEISGNSSANYGGGVYVYSSSTTNMDSTYGALLTIEDNAQITGNEAPYGGGVYLRAKSTSYQASLSLGSSSAVLANNTASTEGADIATAGINETLVLTSANSGVVYEADSQGYTIDGWYSDASGSRYTDQTSPTAVTSFTSGTAYALIAAYSKSDLVGVTFLGGSLRYSVSSTDASSYADAASSTDLRLGFTYQLPVDSNGSVTASDVTIYYAVGTDYDALAAYSGYTDTSGTVYKGTAKRRYDESEDVSGGYATYLSNVVVTGIGAAYYANEVYARVWVVCTDSSTSEEVVLASNTVHRSVGDVCEGIAKSYAESQAEDADSSETYATAAEDAYATALCAAYYESQSEALYDGAPTLTDGS